MKRTTFLKHTAAVTAFGVHATLACAGSEDFGLKVEQQLKGKSEKLFGVEQPLDASAPATTGAYRSAVQSAYDQVLVA